MRRAALLLALTTSACGAYTGSSSPGVPNAEPPPLSEKPGPPLGVDGEKVEPTAPPRCDVAWDINGDGVLEDDEIATGLFRTWDANHDGTLDEVELAAGAAALPGPMRAHIERLEAQIRPAAVAAFRYWDRNEDGVIDEDELTRSTVVRFDVNRDGVIEPDEWPVG